MKPKPFSELNHFTVPCAIRLPPSQDQHGVTPCNPGSASGVAPADLQRKSGTPAFSFRERGKHEHRNYGLRGRA
jgi:hypothetical protein